jgi:hypothetical protein
LKNHQKIPFIQELVDEAFALGAWHLSWHNYANQRLILRA